MRKTNYVYKFQDGYCYRTNECLGAQLRGEMTATHGQLVTITIR